MISFSTVMVILKWPPPMINKSNMYFNCNYTVLQRPQLDLAWTGVTVYSRLSTSAMNCVHSASQLPWSCW
jgi:hypothetical protein